MTSCAGLTEALRAFLDNELFWSQHHRGRHHPSKDAQPVCGRFVKQADTDWFCAAAFSTNYIWIKVLRLLNDKRLGYSGTNKIGCVNHIFFLPWTGAWVDSRSCVMVNCGKPPLVPSKANMGSDNHAWHRHGNHIITFFFYFACSGLFSCICVCTNSKTVKYDSKVVYNMIRHLCR